MKFKYTALSPNNQKQTGALDAESLDAAKEKLHKLNLSIIDVSETTEEEAKKLEEAPAIQEAEEGIITYMFFAKDPSLKEINGTIDAQDPYAAYKRLIGEYHFSVNDLYPQSSANPEADSFKQKFEEWNEMLEAEGIETTLKPTAGVKEELEEEGEKMSQEIVDEIDNFIINAKNVIKNHSDQFSRPFLAEIERTLDELERVRASNNLKHITKVCNNLYDLISHPDIVDKQETTTDTAFSGLISKLRQSGFINNQFQFLKAHSLQKKAKRFEKMQTLFAKILKTLNKKKSDEIDKSFAEKIKKRRSKWLSGLTKSLRKKAEEGEESKVKFGQVVSKFIEYAKESNPILRKARKEEMKTLYGEWKEQRKRATEEKSAKKMTTEPKAAKPKKDYNLFFLEADSFVGWLLTFYIIYFFLVSFSLEKNIGLPSELILKTLKSPLILNIIIFLVFLHFALKLKTRYFRQNFVGSLFLFFVTLGVYSLLIINF